MGFCEAFLARLIITVFVIISIIIYYHYYYYIIFLLLQLLIYPEIWTSLLYWLLSWTLQATAWNEQNKKWGCSRKTGPVAPVH